MNLQTAKVTIKGAPEVRNVQTKNGNKTIYEQPAQFQAEGLLFQFPVSVSSPAEAFPLGDYIWDAVSDIQPSQYGPELARRMTLIPVDKFKAAQPSGAKA